MGSIEKVKNQNKIHMEEINLILDKIQKQTFDDIDTSNLKTYDEIDININLSQEEKLIQYLLQQGNLYFGRCKNGVLVQRCFTNNGKTMQDRIIENINR